MTSHAKPHIFYAQQANLNGLFVPSFLQILKDPKRFHTSRFVGERKNIVKHSYFLSHKNHEKMWNYKVRYNKEILEMSLSEPFDAIFPHFLIDSYTRSILNNFNRLFFAKKYEWVVKDAAWRVSKKVPQDKRTMLFQRDNQRWLIITNVR